MFIGFHAREGVESVDDAGSAVPRRAALHGALAQTPEAVPPGREFFPSTEEKESPHRPDRLQLPVPLWMRAGRVGAGAVGVLATDSTCATLIHRPDHSASGAAAARQPFFGI